MFTFVEVMETNFGVLFPIVFLVSHWGGLYIELSCLKHISKGVTENELNDLTDFKFNGIRIEDLILIFLISFSITTSPRTDSFISCLLFMFIYIMWSLHLV